MKKNIYEFKYKMEKNKIYQKTFLKKWKEIDKEIYLEKVKKNNSIINKTLNFNIFKFLNDKYEHDFYKGLSEFNEEIKSEITKWEDNLVETKDGYLCGDLYLEITIKSLKTNEILLTTYYKMFIKINKKITKKLIELLFDRAYSGIYESPWLEEEIYEEMKSCDLIPKNSTLSYCCDTCNQKFNSLKEFLSHLIENNHYDSIFYRYRKYPEIKNLSNRILPKGDNILNEKQRKN